MNVQRNLGFLLVVLQAAMLALCFRTNLFSVVVVITALVGTISNIRLASTDTAARRWPLILAVMYIVQRAAVPIAWYSGTNGFLFPRSCLIAEYFLAYQVLQFFVRREGNRLPRYLPILAIVTITFAADVQVNAQGRLVVQSLIVVQVALMAAFLAACRLRRDGPVGESPRWRSILLGLVLVATGAVGWATASGLNRYARDIEMALGAAMQSSGQTVSAGFSGQGRLGSVAKQKGTAGSRVALRVFADDEPGYLRGRAFDTYSSRQWRDGATRFNLPPDDDVPIALQSGTGEHTFRLNSADYDSGDVLEIWPNQAFGRVVFVPLGTAALRAPVGEISVNIHGIIEAENLPTKVSYTAWRQDAAGTLPEPMKASSIPPMESLPPPAKRDDTLLDQWHHLTDLPPDLDPRIRELSARVVAEAETDSEKIAAVKRHFLDNYQYQFGIEIPEDEEPLTYFLLQRPPAHCEYFASGAAVLLRAAGVPCRYVTGFVTAEANKYGGYWVARNQDAHAWVEAYDCDRGWVLVEATPTNGVPDSTDSSTYRQMWDSLQASWQRFVASVRQDGIGAIAALAIGSFKRPATLVMVLLAVAVYLLRRLARRRRSMRRSERDPIVIQLHKLLRQVDQRCGKRGLVRAPHETLHQFARRVESAGGESDDREAAAWYRSFAAVRYGGRADAAAVRGLEATSAKLTAQAVKRAATHQPR